MLKLQITKTQEALIIEVTLSISLIGALATLAKLLGF